MNEHRLLKYCQACLFFSLLLQVKQVTTPWVEPDLQLALCIHCDHQLCIYLQLCLRISASLAQRLSVCCSGFQ